MVEFVLAHADEDPAIVAIDAPLVVPNEAGRRPAEAEIGSVFARYHASAHSANRKLLAPNGTARGEELVGRLEVNGFVHRAEVEALTPARQVIEVYPHPAIVSIFDLDEIIKYKARKKRSHDLRLTELGRYQACLRSLESKEPALLDARELLNLDPTSLIKARLKDYEDRLDGLMCAYIAHYLWRWGMARARVFGNLSEGYIVSPVPRTLWSSGE